MEQPKLRSRLRTAKGYGSAKGGVNVWWKERLTALALIPLCLWFVYQLLSVMIFSATAAEVSEWMNSPLNALLMALLIITGFWHAALGNQVIIEDYVHTPCCKFTLIIANHFSCTILGAVSLIAVLWLHLDWAGH